MIFYSGCTNWQFHQQCTANPFTIHSSQHLLFVIVLIIAIMINVRWYSIVVLMCITLTTSHVDIFSCACWPSVCLLWKNVYSGIRHFFNRIVCYLTLSCMIYLIYFGCCLSDAKSRLTLCNPMYCSMPGFPVFIYLLEFAQIHIHWVSNAI